MSPSTALDIEKGDLGDLFLMDDLAEVSKIQGVCDDVVEPRPKRSKKNVRISPDPSILGYVEPLSEMSHDEIQNCWWDKDVLWDAKITAKSQCRELRHRGHFRGCLTYAYNQACHVAENDGDESRDDENIHQILEQPNMRLVDWCADGESPRGLERWASKIHGKLRGRSVGEVKNAVLMEQTRQFLIQEHDDIGIAKAASAASRPSRVFARLLGEADAEATIKILQPRKRKREDLEDDVNGDASSDKLSASEGSHVTPPVSSDEEEGALSPTFDFDFLL